MIFPIKERDSWLNFDLFQTESLSDYEEVSWKYLPADNTKNTILLSLNQASPISIRVYTTDVSTKDVTEPDYGQMTYDKDGKPVVVIPGTSWAGAFRHHMAEALGGDDTKAERDLEALFGRVRVKKSDIVFSETYFENCEEPRSVSRNAVDRFSGGVSNLALFTERVFWGGKNGVLKIEFPETETRFLQALAVSIADLQEGFLAIGGETSIGHGLFKVAKITCFRDGKMLHSEKNGISGESIYSCIMTSFGEK